MSKAANSALTSVGVLTADKVVSLATGQRWVFDRQTVDSTRVTVKYTYGADADLNSITNVDDADRRGASGVRVVLTLSFP